MALHFSANQYEKEFHSKRLQNWEVPKRHRDRPRTLEGFTQIVTNDRGHLNPGVARSGESAWGTFVGTWDRKCHLPGNYINNPTARAKSGSGKVTDETDVPIRTPIMTPKLEGDSKPQSGKQSPCSGRSGARSPDLKPTDQGSPIPTPGREAIYTPTMEQVTARMITDKSTSPKPVTPPVDTHTPPPPSAGPASSRYPDHHHFTYFEGRASQPKPQNC